MSVTEASAADNISVFTELDDLRFDEDFLDKNIASILSLVINDIILLPVTAFGVVTNVLNILIFSLTGQKDSVTIGLTALAVSDLGYLLLGMVSRFLALLETHLLVESSYKLGKDGIGHYMTFIDFAFQDSSMMVTVIVAVQKCCCVAIPHLFKDFFSARKTILIIALFTAAIFGTNIPRLAGLEFREVKPFPYSNETKIAMVKMSLFFKARSYWLSFNRLAYPLICQLITIICVFVMTSILMESTKFRSTGADASETNSKVSLGNRERRAVTAVTIVAVVFVVSMIPWFIQSISRLAVPEFFDNPKNETFRGFVYEFHSILVNISASINIFIYLKYNTKFKQTAYGLLSGRLCLKKKLSRREGCTE